MNTIEASERCANSRRWRVSRQRDWSYKHKASSGRNGRGAEPYVAPPEPRLPRFGLGGAGAYD